MRVLANRLLTQAFAHLAHAQMLQQELQLTESDYADVCYGQPTIEASFEIYS